MHAVWKTALIALVVIVVYRLAQTKLNLSFLP